MPQGVLIATITALSAVIVALLTVGLPLLASARKHARQANEQVTNKHTTNLRDEQDERHKANTSRLGSLEAGQRQLVRSITRIEDHLGIERTTPRPSTRRKTT